MAAALVTVLKPLPPGRALDLACGAGRHAIFLAQLGWQVTAVDIAPGAMPDPAIEVCVADLESGGFPIAPGAYDLIIDWLYFQRDLIPQIQAGVRAGGVAALCFRVSGRFAADTAELRGQFEGWEVLHYAEDAERVELIVRQTNTAC
jgi:tellurite methyltransferase